MANIYIALLFGWPPFFRLPLMPGRSTTLPISQTAGAAAGRELKGREQGAGRENIVNCILCEIFLGCLSMISSLLYVFHMIHAKSCPIGQSVREWQTETAEQTAVSTTAGAEQPFYLSVYERHLSVTHIQRDEVRANRFTLSIYPISRCIAYILIYLEYTRRVRVCL